MIIKAEKYWTKILSICIKKTNKIPKEYFYLITQIKSLQKYINHECIKEFLEKNIDDLLQEIAYTKGLRDFVHGGKYKITSSYNTEDIENIIKEVFDVKYIDDESVEILKRRL